MILTVTMNPSVDTRYELEQLVIDDVNRVTPMKTAGGKGLNVSRVLAQLGADVLATGVLGGHMGSYLEDLMDADGIPHAFSRVAGESRICLSILHEGNQTELLESGPVIAADELEAFTASFTSLVKGAACVTLSGSLPRGVDAGYYATLVQIARAQGIPVLLDTSGTALDAALAAEVKPTLIKPNLSEVNALVGASFSPDGAEELVEALDRDARFAGIEWVVVTMGANGAVAKHGGTCYRVSTPQISAVNATGSGDSTIAGYAYAMAEHEDDVAMLVRGATCGTLNAMDPQTGHLAMDHWDEIINAVSVAEL